MFKWQICYKEMTNFLKFATNARKSRWSQRALQFVWEYRTSFIWVDLHLSLCGQLYPKCEKTVRLLYPHCVNFAHRSTPTNVNLMHQRRGMKEQGTPDSNGSVSATIHNKAHIHSFSQWPISLSPTILTFSPKSPCIVLWLKMHAALSPLPPWDFMASYLMKYRVTFTFYLHIMIYAASH